GFSRDWSSDVCSSDLGVFNPSLDLQGTPLNTFYLVAAALVFFSANGHHLVLMALHRSFQTVPIGSAALADNAGTAIIALASLMFVDALRIGLPVAGARPAVVACLGVPAGVPPQTNASPVGLPVKSCAGSAALLWPLPCLSRVRAPRVTGGVIEAIGRAGAAAR